MPRRRTTTKKLPTARSRGVPAARAAADRAVRVNLPGERLLSLDLPEKARPSFQHEAVRWSYSLRNRERWNTQRDAVREQQEAMSELAARLGLKADHLDRIADTGIVEVDIPWTCEEDDWELRIFPWEFLLATATQERRAGGKQPLTVVRRLRRLGSITRSCTITGRCSRSSRSPRRAPSGVSSTACW